MELLSYLRREIVGQTLRYFLVYFCISGSILVSAKQVLAITPKATECNEVEIRRLIELGRNPASFSQVSTALKKCGQFALPALIEQTNVKNNEKNRISAIFFIAELEFFISELEAESAIPILAALAKDSNKNIRFAAIDSLGTIGKAAAPTLRTILRNNDVDSRAIAALILSDLGIVEESAIPVYIEILSNKSYEAEVRHKALSALSELGPEAKVAIPALIKAKMDSDDKISSRAYEILKKLGVQQEPSASTGTNNYVFIGARVINDIIAKYGFAGTFYSSTSNYLSGSQPKACKNRILKNIFSLWCSK